MAEDLHNCSMCTYSCSELNLLVKHTVRDHKYDPNFLVHCTICGTSFKKWNSFQKHVKRKHTGAMPVVGDINQQNPDPDNSDPIAEAANLESVDEVEIEENTDQNNVTVDEMQWNTARFILTIKEKCRVSQTAVDEVLDATKELVNQVVTTMEKRLEETCLRKNINFHEIVSDEDTAEEWSLFDTSYLFDNVKSEYLQNKFFKENFNLVDPRPIILGEKMVWKSVNHKRRAVKCTSVGYIVPFLDNLKNLLNNEHVLEEVENPHRSNDILQDICDGEFAFGHPIFSVDEKALQIIAYYDDVEIANPIGYKVKKHKVGLFYYTLGNITPWYRSTIRSIQLIAVAKTSDLREFGTEKILMPFISGVNELAKDEGWKTTLYDGEHVFRGTLIAFCADTLGSHFMAGFVEGVGTSLRKCRHCWCVENDMYSKFTEDRLQERNLFQHMQLCDMSEDPDLYKFVKTTFGITRRSVLAKVRYFDITKCFPHDVMHDLYEGLLPYEMKLLLQHVTGNLDGPKQIGVDEINRRIEDYNYDYPEKKDKPIPISKKILKQDSKESLKQSAVQMVCLAFHLPFIIGDVIQEDDSKWKCFLLLLKITSICSAYEIKKEHVHVLRLLIAEHHTLFQETYPNANFIPKMHYLVHYPSLILSENKEIVSSLSLQEGQICKRGIGNKEKAAFREAFGRLSELRSFLETGTPVLALTATANKDMRTRLAKYLGTKSSTQHMVVSPNKDNIRFTVLPADKELHCFDWLISLLQERKVETPFTIIFCKTVNNIVSLLTFSLMRLGTSGIYVEGEESSHFCILFWLTPVSFYSG